MAFGWLGQTPLRIIRFKADLLATCVTGSTASFYFNRTNCMVLGMILNPKCAICHSIDEQLRPFRYVARVTRSSLYGHRNRELN